MVDIIISGIARNGSDWLHTATGFVHYATRIRRNQPSRLVRSLDARDLIGTGIHHWMGIGCAVATKLQQQVITGVILA